MDFADLIPSVRSGTLDVAVAAITDTKEREQVVDMVTYYSGGILWAQRPGLPINPDDACGLSVAVQATTIQQTDELPAKNNKCVADGKAPIHILSFEGQDQATNALLQGQADAATADSMVTAYMIKVSGGRLVPAGQMFDAAPMGWVIAKGSPLALSLRQALERLIASGRYTKILDNWGVGVGAISNPQINAGIS